MAALDLPGRRWLLRILWELRAEPLRFRALRERCADVSPSVLNTRLRELRGTGLVESDPASGYRLTRSGRGLLRALAPLNDWARSWARGAGQR